MSVEHDIQIFIERMRQADIPLDRLCYWLDEHEWRTFTEYLEGFRLYGNTDLSYVERCLYKGLQIRKRADDHR